MKIQEIVRLAGKRAENFYVAHKLCCAEAVIVVLNQAFGGSLTPEVAVRLGSGFCQGMGGAGCTCGALAGAEITLGLFLSPRQVRGMKKKRFRQISKEVHDRFKTRFASACCRTLIEMAKEKKGASCRELTMGGAEIAAMFLLETKPELAETVDMRFLQTHDSKLSVLIKSALGTEMGNK